MLDLHIAFPTRTRTDVPAAAPSASAAIMAGLVAGTLALGVMQSMSLLVYDEPPWKIARMMASLVRGPAALAPEGEFDAGVVALGIGAHYTLSVLYALALAGMLRELPRHIAPLAGLAFGLALYFANLHGFTQLFPWFAELRTLDTFVAHAVFGIVTASLYSELATN